MKKTRTEYTYIHTHNHLFIQMYQYTFFIVHMYTPGEGEGRGQIPFSFSSLNFICFLIRTLKHIENTRYKTCNIYISSIFLFPPLEKPRKVRDTNVFYKLMTVCTDTKETLHQCYIIPEHEWNMLLLPYHLTQAAQCMLQLGYNIQNCSTMYRMIVECTELQ